MRSSTFAKFSTGYIYSLWETKKLCSNIWIWEWNMSDCRMAQSAMLVFSEWVICRAVNGASRNFTVPGKGPYSWKCEPTSNFTIKNLLRQQRSKAARQWISLQTSMFKRRNFTNSHFGSSSECVICSFEPTAAVFVCGTFNNSSKWIIKMFLKW